jgi:hypothetical protein
MQKLEFVFIDGEEEIIRKECSYEKVNNSIEFFYEDYKFSYIDNLEETILTRECQDNKLIIKNNKGILECNLKTFDPDYEVIIKVVKFEVKKHKNEYIICYELESDEGIEKRIILSLLN